MRGTVKWFNAIKGYGYITDLEGQDHFFHYSSIQMDGFRSLEAGDIAEFEIGTGKTGREQAVNVSPVLTDKMVRHALKCEKMQLNFLTNAFGQRAYIAVDENNVIQTDERGITLVEMAAFAGFDTEGLE